MSTVKERPEKATEKAARPQGNFFENLIHIDPVHVVSDMWDAFDMWRVTRRWRPMLLMIPGILLFSSVTSTVVYGIMIKDGKLGERYAKKAAEIAPIKEDGVSEEDKEETIRQATAASRQLDKNDLELEEDGKAKLDKNKRAEQDAKNADYADMLYQRVLQINPDDKNAAYFVAHQVGIRGNMEQARKKMKLLAPSDTTLFPRAHAWMAGDMLQQFYAGNRNIDKDELHHHLLIAAEWPGTSAFILSAYAQMLEVEGKSNEAISMLQRAAARDHAFYLPLSAMMQRHNQPVQAREMADRAISHYSETFGKKDEPDRDRIAVAEAHVQAKKHLDALKVLDEGLKLRPDRPLLKRAKSNLLRLMYRAQLTPTESGIKANLGLLNAALMEDPTNPGVGEEIAWLQNLGVVADDNMIQALREQLASGGASAITHLLLGNAYMNKHNMGRAIEHWQLALGQDSNLVLAMNNLAYGFSAVDPPRFDEALKLIDRALELSPDPEFLDSKGEILERAGRNSEAIIQYEKAIQADQWRVATREKLVRCYEAAGMQDMADAHLQKIGIIRDQLKAANLSDRGRPRPATQPPPIEIENKKETNDDVVVPLSEAVFDSLPSNTKKPEVSDGAEK